MDLGKSRPGPHVSFRPMRHQLGGRRAHHEDGLIAEGLARPPPVPNSKRSSGSTAVSSRVARTRNPRRNAPARAPSAAAIPNLAPAASSQ
jgi:hypothetical protein